MPVIAQLEQFHERAPHCVTSAFQPVDETIADSLGLGSAHGALIARVDANGRETGGADGRRT